MGFETFATKYQVIEQGKFTRDSYRFFDPLVAFVAGYAGTVMSIEAHQKGQVERFHDQSTVAFKAQIAEHVIACNPAWILDKISVGDWIEELPYAKAKIPKTLPPLLARN